MMPELTKRQMIFANEKHYWFISDIFEGDKTEMEECGMSPIPYTWEEIIMSVMGCRDSVTFVKSMSNINMFYYMAKTGATSADPHVIGTKIHAATNYERLYDFVKDADEVWMFRSDRLGVELVNLDKLKHFADLSSIGIEPDEEL